MFGADPRSILQPESAEDYYINIAMLKKAVQLDTERRVAEREDLGIIIANEVNKALVAAFGRA